MQIRGFGSLFGAGERRSDNVRFRPRKLLELGRRKRFESPARDLAQRLIGLRDNVEKLKKSIQLRKSASTSRRAELTPASVSTRLRPSVGGPVSPPAPTPAPPSELRSSRPVLGTSNSPNGLEQGFSGASSARLTFDGTYDGSQGKNVSLRFVVKRGGVVGQRDVTLEVQDELGNRVDQVKIDKEAAAETFKLSNGVEFTLSSGSLAKKDSFSLALSSGDGTVDSGQAFRGSGLPESAQTFAASFNQGSSAQATLGGRFEGALDDTLTFRVRDEGVLGQDDVEIEVFGSDGERQGRAEFKKKNFTPGATVALDNGLTLSFSEGELLKKDEFQVDVRADDELVLEGGRRVQPGSFTINDSTITVEESDSIDSVLAQISQSDADVSARFDRDSQSIVLTPDEGSRRGIRFGTDTSGFLDAVGLAGAELSPPPSGGAGSPTDGEPAEVTDVRLRGVGRGSFSINGRSIEVDEQKDSLEDVVARIQAADAGVEASVRGGRFEIRSTDPRSSLEIENGTSSFFSALGIEEGVHLAEKVERRTERRTERITNARSFRRSLTNFSNSLNQVLLGGSERSGLPDIRTVLEESIRSIFDLEADDRPPVLSTGLGLRFRFSGGEDPLDVDLDSIDRAISRDSKGLADFLVQERDENGKAQGLLDSITDAVNQTLDDLLTHLDPSLDAGLLIDIRA